MRWLIPDARTPDELPLGRSELRLIGRNFEADHYYSELFSVIGATVTKPILKDPINPVTKLCDAIDDRLARTAPAAVVYYPSVVIRGTKEAEPWGEWPAPSRSRQRRDGVRWATFGITSCTNSCIE